MLDVKRIDDYMAKVSGSQQTVFPAKGRLKTGLDLGTAYIVLVVLDENNEPVACEKQAASVLRDGVVVDYTGASRIVRELKAKLEERLGRDSRSRTCWTSPRLPTRSTGSGTAWW